MYILNEYVLILNKYNQEKLRASKYFWYNLEQVTCFIHKFLPRIFWGSRVDEIGIKDRGVDDQG